MKKLPVSTNRYTPYIAPLALDNLAKSLNIKIEFEGKVLVRLNGVNMTRTEAFEVLTILI